MGLAGEVAARIVRRQCLVCGRIPEDCVQAVEDPAETVAEPGQDRIHAHPECRGQNLVRVAGADGVDQLGALDPFAQQQQPILTRGHELGDLVRSRETRQLRAR